MSRKNTLFTRLLCIIVIFSMAFSISATAVTPTYVKQTPVLYSSASVNDVSDDILEYLDSIGVNITENTIISAGKLTDDSSNIVYSLGAQSENTERETYYVTVSDKVGDSIETTTILRAGTGATFAYNWPPANWDDIRMYATAHLNYINGAVETYVQPQKVTMYYTSTTTATFVSTVFGCVGNKYLLPNYTNQGASSWAATAVSYNPSPQTTYTGTGASLANYVFLPDSYNGLYLHFRYKLSGDTYETDQVIGFTVQDIT